MTARALAQILDGTVVDNNILIPHPDGTHLIECRPTGRVILDRSWQLGSFTDGPDLLAARYRMVTEPTGEPSRDWEGILRRERVDALWAENARIRYARDGAA